MTPEALAADVDSGSVDTVVLAFTDLYGRLLGKRLDAEFFVAGDLAGTHGCDYLLTVDMEMEPVPGYAFANWDLGYGDVYLHPDLDTLRSVAWSDRTVVVLCDVVDEATHELVSVAPRSLLRRQIERAAAMGFQVKAASELEFFLFDDSYRAAAEAGYADLTPAGWYLEDYHLLQGARVEHYIGRARRALAASGIPVESSKGEWGRGQHELNIRYADVLSMADRHSLMKHGMKELADAAEVSVTFMAKPHTEEAGSSSHLHVSLWDPDGETNLFASDNGRHSDLFRWFLGGWMAHVPDFTVFYAPTVNSYKRFQDGSWAPTRIAWSEDNRTAGFRVVGAGPSTRIECRIPGADCNPYLAYAATLAAGMAGIEQQLEPPPEISGDAYEAKDLPRVAHTLAEATAAFASSDSARAAFGGDVVDHYAHFFTTETEAYRSAVTDWERRRYFERI